MSPAATPRHVGKFADVTGPGVTDRLGVTCTDLGASVAAPDGSLVSVFGDTFAGPKVGAGDWRSPVVLIGSGDAGRRIRYDRAGGGDPDYARQLWHYEHREPVSRLDRGAISTVIPSDLLRVGPTLYLHAIVNRGFGTVVWTEIWCSDDGGVSWRNAGARFPARLHRGHAQCWSWEYDPDDGWVYVASTGFQRNKGIILRRVRPADIGDPRRYSGWGYRGSRRGWGRTPAPITPAGERWGELSLRRLAPDTWVLGGFVASRYALGYRVLRHPTDELARAPLQLPITGCGWDDEDHDAGRVAQLYGGYLLPGSRVDRPGGVGLLVSQWNTAAGWPYRVMQFRVTLDGGATAAPATSSTASGRRSAGGSRRSP
ncbi:DUF4185 domain-containing protein [Mycobacterium sp. M1]|uniref:DUF4185 domain-containing protein n=1 Tax=Mycolicibacter acidiphilus TaxID=2835306 RepID=A0ABS5RP06_9MYCO|nr:DUF4185 domain-containing protein [Mycolicibacter acidiphilus]MBS9536041.1 DUF4185 domain-containing protein [Mycolicibacter acidiphilus]